MRTDKKRRRTSYTRIQYNSDLGDQLAFQMYIKKKVKANFVQKQFEFRQKIVNEIELI